MREAVKAFEARDHGVDELLNLLDDVDHWEDGVVEMRAVGVLVALGASADVVGCWVDLVADLHPGPQDEPSTETVVLMSIGRAVGELADVDTVRIVLDALDARLADNTLPVGWRELVETLAHFKRRGQHEPRTWDWLERVRADDPFLWSRFVSGTGDERAVAPLQALLDGAGVDGVDDGLAAADANVAWRAHVAITSLASFGPLRDVDLARDARAVALLTALAAPAADPRV